jgi:hypothetical protein
LLKIFELPVISWRRRKKKFYNIVVSSSIDNVPVHRFSKSDKNEKFFNFSETEETSGRPVSLFGPDFFGGMFPFPVLRYKRSGERKDRESRASKEERLIESQELKRGDLKPANECCSKKFC